MVLPEKPPHGTPCNGCGGCCINTLCPLGQLLFGRQRGPCPALEIGVDRADCGLVANPDKYASLKVKLGATTQERSDAAKLTVGIGRGCDALIEGETQNVAFSARLKRDSVEHRRRGDGPKALKAWGIDV